MHPKLDAPTSVVVDASDTGVGAVLQQRIDCEWCPISFFSKKLKPSETRYSTFDGELLAISLAVKHFLHFLESQRAIFDSLHSLSHPGIRAKQRLLTARYLWPSINTDVRRWAQSCPQCPTIQSPSPHCYPIVNFLIHPLRKVRATVCAVMSVIGITSGYQVKRSIQVSR